jgi:hypothetical protein
MAGEFPVNRFDSFDPATTDPHSLVFSLGSGE